MREYLIHINAEVTDAETRTPDELADRLEAAIAYLRESGRFSRPVRARHVLHPDGRGGLSHVEDH